MNMEGIGFEEIILAALFLIAFIVDFVKAKKRRKEIKVRANREYSVESELSKDELESRLGESELMYEDLEQTYWVHIGMLVGVCAYLYWHVWYIAILITVTVVLVGWRYLTIRPFTSGIPNI